MGVVSLDQLNKACWMAAGLALIVIIGFFDYMTGNELAWTLFYLIPVSMVSWFIGRAPGIAIALLSALTEFFANLASGRSYSNTIAYYWNSFSSFGFFLLVSWLLSSLHTAMIREQELSRLDYATGAVTSRYFQDLLAKEIDRCLRYQHPFTIAYIDLDNFKAINDTLGHYTGDVVLRRVTYTIRNHVRRTDVVARMGGDEFIVLLIETNQEGAKSVIAKMQSNLLQEMRYNAWPVTFSTGVLTCINSPCPVDEMIRMADSLMYSVKHSTKNGIAYAVHQV